METPTLHGHKAGDTGSQTLQPPPATCPSGVLETCVALAGGALSPAGLSVPSVRWKIFLCTPLPPSPLPPSSLSFFSSPPLLPAFARPLSPSPPVLALYRPFCPPQLRSHLSSKTTISREPAQAPPASPAMLACRTSSTTAPNISCTHAIHHAHTTGRAHGGKACCTVQTSLPSHPGVAVTSPCSPSAGSQVDRWKLE